MRNAIGEQIETENPLTYRQSGGLIQLKTNCLLQIASYASTQRNQATHAYAGPYNTLLHGTVLTSTTA